MLQLTLFFAALATHPAPPKDVPLPPPPAGMRVLGSEDRRLLLGMADEATPATSDESDAADTSEDVEKESAELEEVRALEDAALDPKVQPEAQVLQSVRRLGLANPLRQRMLDALDEPLRNDEEALLPRVMNPALLDMSQVRDRYDIPVEMQPLVAQYIQFFQGPGRKWFRKWMSRSKRYIPLMQPILEAEGLPRDTVYLAMIESGFATHAYSWARAAGPWQFIAATGKRFGLRQDFWVDERRDPFKATRAAAGYLKQLFHELGHWYLAWAGYNAGSGRVKRVIRKLETEDFWALSEGRGLAKETKHYVPKLIACALVAKNPQAFGFRDEEFQFEPPFLYDEVKLTDATDLEVIARAAGVPLEEIEDLNPELKRSCTPPASLKSPYALRLPKGTAEKFAENLARIPPKERLTFRVRKVKRGDTLSRIAHEFGSVPEAIMQMNHLKSVRALKVGSELVIPVPAFHGAQAAAEGPLARKAAQARRNGIAPVRPEEEIPAGQGPTTLARGAVQTDQVDGKTRITYAVQAGDSLWTIAQHFQVSVADLKRWNGLPERGGTLHIGARLVVWPEGAASRLLSANAPPAAP